MSTAQNTSDLSMKVLLAKTDEEAVWLMENGLGPETKKFLVGGFLNDHLANFTKKGFLGSLDLALELDADPFHGVWAEKTIDVVALRCFQHQSLQHILAHSSFCNNMDVAQRLLGETFYLFGRLEQNERNKFLKILPVVQNFVQKFSPQVWIESDEDFMIFCDQKPSDPGPRLRQEFTKWVLSGLKSVPDGLPRENLRASFSKSVGLLAAAHSESSPWVESLVPVIDVHKACVRAIGDLIDTRPIDGSDIPPERFKPLDTLLMHHPEPEKARGILNKTYLRGRHVLKFLQMFDDKNAIEKSLGLSGPDSQPQPQRRPVTRKI